MESAMDLSVDKLGRVVIPKSVRQQFHLQAGSKLRLVVHEGNFSLEPLHEQIAGLVEKDGMLVFTGSLPPNFDAVGHLQALRDERDRANWGIDAPRS
jgi:AbrB family looped-hinge helix DNA binding protein